LPSRAKRVSSVDPRRKSKERVAGSNRQSVVKRGELVVVKPVERFDPEGWKQPEGEWRPDDITGALEIGANNGSKVMKPPGIGFETEPSGGASGRAGSQRDTGAEAKLRVTNFRLRSTGRVS
jgi:hypothetical protein